MYLDERGVTMGERELLREARDIIASTGRGFEVESDLLNRIDAALSRPEAGDVVITAIAWQRLVEIHRGWCNYCRGNPTYCFNAPAGSCSLRDCLLSAHESEKVK